MSTDQDKTNSNPDKSREEAREKARDRAAYDKPSADERRKNRDKVEKRGGKDDTVLGEINDE